MNILDNIKTNFETFTKIEKDLANKILENPKLFATTNIISLSKNLKISKSAIIRFTQKLGYKGFSEFKFSLARNLHTRSTNKTSIIDIYIEYLNKLKTSYDEDDLNELVQKIITSKRIILCGFNRSYHSASQLSLRLLKIGLESYVASDASTLSDLCNLSNKDDIFIGFTTSDNTKSFTSFMKLAKNTNMKTVLFTMTSNLPCKKYVDSYILLPKISLASTDFLDDQAIFFVFIEVLLSNISNNLNKDIKK